MYPIDGTWTRIITMDGEPVLELRDPNDGQGSDPATKTRYQYRIAGGWLLLRRMLPPESVGDRWRGDEIDDPWWEPVMKPPRPGGGPIHEYWERHRDQRISVRTAAEYAFQARHAAGHAVAYTPNGREVRRGTDGSLEVQAHDDNYWLTGLADLPAARRAYYRGK